MLRNLSKTLLMAAAAWLAAASALSAQQPGGEPLRGDVNGDGAVTAADARIVADYLVGKPVPAGVNVAARGDVNGDGRVTSVDAAIIAGFAAGRANVDRFKVGLPAGELPANAMARIVCVVKARGASVSCGEPASTPDGLRATEMYTGGPNGTYVKLTSSSPPPADAEGNLKFTVTVENKLGQRIGTTEDGVTPHPDGVRVFFDQQPTAVGPGGGQVQVMGAQTGTFVGGPRPYYGYTAPLDPGEISEAVEWHFKLDPGVTDFTFTVYVWGHGLPGWIDITPPAHTPSAILVPVNYLVPGDSLDVTGQVRNSFGVPLGTPVGSWTSSNPAIATVSSTSSHTARIKAVAEGVDTVTASSMPPTTTSSNARIGRTQIVSTYGDSAASTITANPTSLAAGGTSIVTVQAKFPDGTNVPKGGATVALTASPGGALTVVDNNDGTYTANLTSNTAGVVTVSGTLNGRALDNTATVTFTSGAASGMAANSATSQSATVGTAVAAPPSVKVTDAHGNAVAGVVVTFTVSTGGGQVSNGVDPAGASATVTTDAAGVATLTNWTVGTTAGTDNNTVTASATGLTDVVFTASGTPGAAANMAKSAGDAQSATVNTAVAIAPAVTITDAHGNGVPGVSVTFAVASGGGSVTGGSATTDASGVATVGSWTLGTTAGANTLDASSTGLTTVTFTATGTPDVPANIAKTAGDEQTGTIGAAVAVAPQVTVTDQHGNPVPSVTVTFSVTGGGGSVTDATPATNASGVATVGSWTLGSGPTANTLQASVSVGTASPVTFTAYVPPTAQNDSSEVMGNTNLPSSAGRNVLSNDVSINGGAVSLTTTGELATVRGGTVNLAADGTFTYLPPAGNVLRDSVEYTISDTKATAHGWIKFRFVGKVWYVDSSHGGASDGRLNTPFTGIGAAAAAAGANDTILVRTGSGTTAGGSLKAGQLVHGQGGNAFTVTLNGESVTLLAAGTDPSVGVLTLASGNTLHGFASTGGITGVGFGTLAVSDVSINNPSGQALSLNNGTLNGSFSSVQSGGGTNNVSLTGVATTGTATLGTAGDALSGATSDAVVISGGSGSLTIPAHVTNATSLAVNVNGKTGGTVTFSGNINPGAAGRGISVSGNNSGSNSISFTGSQNISSGTAAGVSLSNNTGATISFSGAGTGLDVTTSTGTGFSATGGGTVEVGGSGNTVTVSGAAARAVELNGITIPAGGIAFSNIQSNGTTTGTAFLANNVSNSGGGSFTAGSITVAGTTGASSRGIEVSSSSAPFTFTTASVNGTGAQGILLNGNTAAVAINGGTVGNTTSTTGDALSITNGNAAVTVAATLTKSTAGRIANITGRTAGTTTVSGNLSCTGACTGINAGSNTGGTIDFSGGTKTLNTGANTAVTLASNTGSTINFSNGGLVITTSTATGFNATGGGEITVGTGANPNTVASTAGGRVVNIQNTNIGSGNVTFRSVNGTGSGVGVKVENTGTAGGFKITGDGSTASSGGILTLNGVTAADSAAFSLTNTGNVSLEFVRAEVTTGNGATGIAATNLTGTNLVRNSTIDFNSVAPAASPAHGSYAARFVQSSSSATITLDGVSFLGKLDGTTAGSLSAGGTATVNFNVIDSNLADAFNSTFQGLFGSAWVIGSGETGGSTGTVNLTIRDSKFLNAAANGTNNLELGANAASTLNYKIKDNQFSGVTNASFTAGIINLQSFDTAVLGGTTAMDSITGNTITNSGTSSAVTDLGYIGIRVAVQSSSPTTHRVVIHNNQITDLWRQGVLLSTRQSATGHFKVVNNVIGSLAAPVGQSGRRGLETDLQDNSVMNLEATGNTFTATSTIDTRAAMGVRVGTNSGSATLNATVLSNTMQSTVAGNNGRFSAESAATGSGTMCLDLRSNTLDGAGRLFTVTQSGGIFRVEGAGAGAVSSASITSANTVGTGNVSGTVNFNNGANCTQPPI